MIVVEWDIIVVNPQCTLVRKHHIFVVSFIFCTTSSDKIYKIFPHTSTKGISNQVIQHRLVVKKTTQTREMEQEFSSSLIEAIVTSWINGLGILPYWTRALYFIVTVMASWINL